MFYSKSANAWFDPDLRASYERTGTWPDDAVEYPVDVFDRVVRFRPADKLMQPDADGHPVLVDLPPPTVAEIVAGYTEAIQDHLDEFARTRGYDGILSACTYATSAVQKFRAEGQYCVDARDATWAKCYEILAAVESGARPMPSLAEIIAELPALTWPA